MSDLLRSDPLSAETFSIDTEKRNSIDLVRGLNLPNKHTQENLPSLGSTLLTTESRGVKSWNKNSYQVFTPYGSKEADQSDLLHDTLADLNTYFKASIHHAPSTAMWEGLVDLIGKLVDMAEGRCDPRFYLSNLDPGVGKTSAIRAFIDRFEAEPDAFVPATEVMKAIGMKDRSSFRRTIRKDERFIEALRQQSIHEDAVGKRVGFVRSCLDDAPQWLDEDAVGG